MQDLKIQENISLKSLNTMGLNVQTRYYAQVADVEELRAALIWQQTNNVNSMILGGGSNVLFTTDFDGLIIHNQIRGMATLQQNDELVHLYVGGGENWHDFVEFTVKRGWYGIENLALIPGLVGAAPIQNIGAYGVELKDVLVRVHALNRETLEDESFSNEECEFGYRNSIFKQREKGKYIIVGIELVLSKIPKVNTEYGAIRSVLTEQGIDNPTGIDVFSAVVAIRQSKLPDPKELGNTGSFFKNPIVPKEKFEEIKAKHEQVPSYPIDDKMVKIPAGWLIEKAGWKGKVVGNTGNHKNQALVIVNYGEATGQEIAEHAARVMDSIMNEFGIRLEAEVNIIE